MSLFNNTRTIVLSKNVLTPIEVKKAFAVPKEQTQFVATLQLLEELEQEAISGSRASIGNHGICAGFVGGAEWLGIARAKLAKTREEAFGERGA